MTRSRWMVCVAAVCAAALGAAQASTVLGLTLEDQARLSRHVVLGEVVAQVGVDHPDNGLETAVTLRVVAGLKGGSQPGDAIVFHTRSGELNGEISVAVGEAVLRTGQTVLVFLEDIDGRLYNIGLSYGVFRAVEDARGRLSLVRAIEDDLHVVDDAGVGDGPFTLEDIRASVAFAARQPRFDNPMVQDAFGKGR